MRGAGCGRANDLYRRAPGRRGFRRGAIRQRVSRADNDIGVDVGGPTIGNDRV